MIDIDIDDPGTWPRGEELIFVTDRLSTSAMLHCYQRGLFAMPLDQVRMGDGTIADVVGWFSPTPRGVLPLQQLRVRRSLRKMARRYLVSVDLAFEQVVMACGDERRDGGWINPDFIACYLELFDQQLAHSVEVWDEEGRLVGGLFGVHLGGLFSGESMFHDAEHGRDASKVALMALVSVLGPNTGRLLDIQWLTDHLATMGASEIPRGDYVDLLSDALTMPCADFQPGVLAPAQWRDCWLGC